MPSGLITPAGASGPLRLVTTAIAFNTPGLTTGVSVFVPTIGQVLYNAWFEVTTAFNGTTPRGEISQFTGSAAPFGLTSLTSNPHPMDQANSINNGGGPANTGASDSGSLLSLIFSGDCSLPATFTSVDPLLVVVTQDGKRNGAATGATAGAAKIRLLVLTP